MTTTASGRNPGLDILRALSALAVFLFHFWLFPTFGNLGAAIVSFPVIVLLSIGLHWLGLQVVALLRRQPRPDPAR